jgi:hypothetical protein
MEMSFLIRNKLNRNKGYRRKNGVDPGEKVFLEGLMAFCYNPSALSAEEETSVYLS